MNPRGEAHLCLASPKEGSCTRARPSLLVRRRTKEPSWLAAKQTAARVRVRGRAPKEPAARPLLLVVIRIRVPEQPSPLRGLRVRVRRAPKQPTTSTSPGIAGVRAAAEERVALVLLLVVVIRRSEKPAPSRRSCGRAIVPEDATCRLAAK